MRKLSVAVKILGAEIHIALRLIRIALINKGGDYIDDIVNVLGRLGMDVRLTDIEPLCIFPKFIDIFFGDLGELHALFIGSLDYFIVNIGEILNEFHLVAPVFKVAAQNVKNAKRARVSDMDIIIYGRAAGVHFDLSGRYRHKLLFLPCQCVVNFHSLIFLSVNCGFLILLELAAENRNFIFKLAKLL